MHRVGFFPEDFSAAHERLRASGKVAKIVMMSHFSRADELDCPRTEEQLAAFAAASQGLEGEISLRNSPAVLGWPKVPSDWVRPGILLYGATPFERAHPLADRLRPVMTLESKVISVRDLPAGEPVGYGARYSTERSQRIGVVAMATPMAIRATPPTAPWCSSTASRGAWLAGYRWTCSPSTLPTIPGRAGQPGRTMGARTCRSAPWRRRFGSIPTSCCATPKRCRASIPGLEKTFRILCAGMSTDLL